MYWQKVLDCYVHLVDEIAFIDQLELISNVDQQNAGQLSRKKVPNFNDINDEDVIKYLIEHFDEFGAGEPEVNLMRTLTDQIAGGTLKIEKRDYGFAIIKPEREKPSGIMAGLIPLESDLMFIYVSPEQIDKGFGKKFLAEMKLNYLKDQAMQLVCAGDKRRIFFETGGFTQIGVNPSGHYVMCCMPQ